MALVASVYYFVAKYGVPSIYNYWVILGLDMLFVVMWVASFAFQASRISPLFPYIGVHVSSYFSYNFFDTNWLSVQAGAAAGGGTQL